MAAQDDMTKQLKQFEEFMVKLFSEQKKQEEEKQTDSIKKLKEKYGYEEKLAKQVNAAQEALESERYKKAQEAIDKKYDQELLKLNIIDSKELERLKKSDKQEDKDKLTEYRKNAGVEDKREQEQAKLKEKTTQKAAAAERNKEANAQFKDAKNLVDGIKALTATFSKVAQVDENGKPKTDEDGNAKTDWGKTIAGGITHLTDQVVSGIAGIAKQLDSQIDSIAKVKGSVDTRLQGSKNKTQDYGALGSSYWDQMSKDITSLAATSPYITQSALSSNVQSLVKSGVAFDVEQRAFLATIKDKIADTFEVSSASLNRLVRLQQQDSTAARLGMESSLTQFLNNMYETTEYMSDIMDSINDSLVEAESLMTTKEATAFEYQVNKWMGSMYSVGMSQSGVTAISGALSKLAAGQIEGLTGSSTGNLLVMAANEAGLSISDLLANGLNDETTNELMEAMVDYLAKIYNQAGDSKVIQQQVASIYGLTASDLKSMLNLTSDGTTLKAISNSYVSYDNAMTQLNNMANTIYQRTSYGEMASNLTENVKYTLAASIANNPAMYATYKLAGLAEDMFGGISIPDVSVVGNGAALNTNVSDILMATALGGGIMSSIGSIVSGIGNSFNMSGALSQLGIGGSNVQSVQRGTGTSTLITTSGATTSQSSAMYSDEGSGAYDKAMASASSQASEAVAGAADEEEQDIKNKVIDEHIVEITTLLNEVVDGGKSFHITFENELSLT